MAEPVLPSVVQRFLRYVQIDTQSAEGVDNVPSTEKQKDLSRLLAAELKELGVGDAEMDEHGQVLGTIPSNVSHAVPAIGLISHMDTSPEVSGAGVKPQLHPAYDGGPIRLADGIELTPEQSPELRTHLGGTIITSDGTTLLGADNKAGCAEIMTLVERLQREPGIPHGPLRIAFTCDEEVGHGTKFFAPRKFGVKYAYTVDGESPGEVENETFCADSVTVTFRGVNVHPGYAKDKLVSAIKAAAEFVGLLPPRMAPETTEKRQGYLHPVSIKGGVEEVVLKVILRDFDERPLRAQRGILEEMAAVVRRRHPRLVIELAFEESYRNMRFILEQHPQVVEHALEAVRRAGLEPRLNLIRGGTDGSRLSFMGVPTPNIFTGGHLFHSRLEWIAVEGMLSAVETLVHLVQIWAERSSEPA
jgi:tripeptide aminopeptidase